MINRFTLPSRLLLSAIILIAGLTRFYNIMWGNGYYFHPDENNMARAVVEMSAQRSLDPHFYAYGQIPLYLAFFSAQVIYSINNIIFTIFNVPSDNFFVSSVKFQDAIFWLRFYAAISGMLIVYFSYRIARKIMPVAFSLLAAFLISFIPGMIQFSRFGTTENLLTALFLVIIGFSMTLIRSGTQKKVSIQDISLLGILFGLSVGIKLSSLYFIFPILMVIVHALKQSRGYKYLAAGKMIVILILTSLCGYIAASPYNIL